MKNSTTAQRLNYIMNIRKLRQSDILNLIKPYCIRYKVKLGKSALSQYISGKVTPKQDKIFILGIALDVAEAWLMGYDVPMERVSSPIESTNNKKTAQTVGERIMKKEDFDIKAFSKRFSELLNNSDENTHTLARKLGLTPATISRYSHGLMAPKFPTLYAMADIFDVNPLWLFGFDAPMERESSPIGFTDKEKKTAQIEPPLSPEQHLLISAVSELPAEDVKKALEYVELLNLKRNS